MNATEKARATGTRPGAGWSSAWSRESGPRGRCRAAGAAGFRDPERSRGRSAVRRNLAVGPPSIEQIYYGLNLRSSKAEQPPLPVVVVSRVVDAPRRIMSWF
ncbi:hypothetical protein [Streptomyces sp. YS415]|uniref:hypothetical protein n=1 Tax=Streptomyces sp. YS415 TaxID=2944806 RepID=UPI002021CD35|nr:hypothetical protein [Streptomyces sp. YS415]MCL7423851.1 hypothetical protein [Streptomyces sp. YS415]